jgi:hypothetical protein
LRALLEEKGLGPVEFQRVAPSLEDAFIALIHKAGGAGLQPGATA